jgi:hypothetical protein
LAAKVRHDSRVHLIAPLPSLMYCSHGAALVIEGDDALRRSRQVGDDEIDARVQLARMPFDLGHDVARLIPALRPIAGAGEEAAYFLRRSPDRALQQISDLALQDGVGRQPDRIAAR